MRASEILRHMADVIDRAEGGQPAIGQQPPVAIPSVEPEDVPQVDQKPDLVVVKVDNTDNADPGVMASPLQQELELLKKAAGVPSAFDGHSK